MFEVARVLLKQRAGLILRGGNRVSINPLVELTTSGQSIWYDGIERGLITSGELKRLIDEVARRYLEPDDFREGDR